MSDVFFALYLPSAAKEVSLELEARRIHEAHSKKRMLVITPLDAQSRMCTTTGRAHGGSSGESLVCKDDMTSELLLKTRSRCDARYRASLAAITATEALIKTTVMTSR